MDLSRGETFILAIVPLHEIGVNFSDGAESGQFTRASRALQRTREDLGEFQAAQPSPKRAGILSALLGQWKISQPSMLTREAPSRFTVPS
jgi:hypothetical protein